LVHHQLRGGRGVGRIDANAGYDEFASLPAALVVWIILPFAISKACALFITIQNPNAQQYDER
jgi:hypothetical protein